MILTVFIFVLTVSDTRVLNSFETGSFSFSLVPHGNEAVSMQCQKEEIAAKFGDEKRCITFGPLKIM